MKDPIMSGNPALSRLRTFAVGSAVASAVLYVLSFIPLAQGQGQMLFGLAVAAHIVVALLSVTAGSSPEIVENEAESEEVAALRRQIEQAHEQVEATKAEAERFTYIVSHDLRSPLLTIQGFSDILKMDVEEGKSEAIEEDLGHIFKATQRMRRLLDDLLELSRIGRFNEPAVETPLGEIVSDALYEIRQLVDETGAEIEVADDLPTLEVDRSRVQQLLRAVLDNAVRYHGEGTTPKIRITSRTGADGPEIIIADNGAGLEPDQLERAFGPFERFSAESEGTGMGLAHARRIALYHRGWIRAESAGKGQGTSIIFALSKPEEDA